MLKKILLGFAALFLVLVGFLILMMGYVFNHPQSIFDAFNSVTAKLTQGESYQEKEEYFLQGIKSLQVVSKRARLEVFPYDGPSLKVELEGKVPHFEKGPFIAQGGDPTNLVIEVHEPMASNWIHININGQESSSRSDSSITAKIYVPKSFVNPIVIENAEGSIEINLSKNRIYELDLQSQSGKIENTSAQSAENINPSEVSKLKALTTTGDITVKSNQ